MATSRTKKTKRNAARSKPAQNARRRSARSKRLVRGRRAKKRSSVAALPGWKDLAKQNERGPGRSQSTPALIEKVSTGRFALLLVGVVMVLALYVGHVHATQDLAADLQQVRKENHNLHLKLNRLKGDFDRATGPAVIYRRARALGLEESIQYGPTIHEPKSR